MVRVWSKAGNNALRMVKDASDRVNTAHRRAGKAAEAADGALVESAGICRTCAGETIG
jgi:hypothetical protein